MVGRNFFDKTWVNAVTNVRLEPRASKASGTDHAPRRRDALLRREALLNAAIECFSTRGYSVSLEEIADHAGVGRGTFYRNFKDRDTLILAIFAREIEKIVSNGDSDLPIEEMMRKTMLRGARVAVLFNRMTIERKLNEEQLEGYRMLGIRAQRLLDPLVDRSHAVGWLRKGVTSSDMMIGLRMLGGLCKTVVPSEEVDPVLIDGLSLLFQGMANCQSS